MLYSLTNQQRVVALALAAVLVLPSFAGSTSPYAGQEARELKALSATDVADLLAGRGMGYAKAAELNGYPGPAHVLQLADALRLSTHQRSETQMIFERMTASAKAIGVKLVAAEVAMDSAFRHRHVKPESLTQMVGEIAGLQSELRNIHLQAHLEQTALLTSSQVSQYIELRGYRQGLIEDAKSDHAHE